MSAAFTPGLWEAIGNDERVEADTIPIKVGEHQVADVYGWPTAERPDMTIAEAEANASLIAAAPKLHDLVRESLYHLRLDDGAKGYHTRALAILSEVRGDQ